MTEERCGVVRTKEIGEAGERPKRPVPKIDLRSALGFKASCATASFPFHNVLPKIQICYCQALTAVIRHLDSDFHRLGTFRRPRGKNAEDLISESFPLTNTGSLSKIHREYQIQPMAVSNLANTFESTDMIGSIRG